MGRVGRPPLAVGTHGDIACAWSEREKAYKARARFRDADGVVRPVARFGKSESAAKKALRDALKERQRGIALDITSDTTVTKLAHEWLERIAAGDLSIGTKQQYRRAVDANVRPALGALRLGGCGVARIDKALSVINSRHGYSVAKIARTCLSGMFDLAVREEAIAANPVRSVERLTGGSRSPARALSVEQTEHVTDWLRTDDRAARWDVPDLVDFMLGTGCRIGEALACRYGRNADGEPLLDLDAGTWEINATTVRVTGSGLVVQEHPESEAGWRVLALPPSIVAILRRRLYEARLQPRNVQVLGDDGTIHTEAVSVVFPAPAGRQLRDPTNTAGDLRILFDSLDCDACDHTGHARDEDGRPVPTAKGRPARCAAGPFSWVTSHTFRKTVATRMEEAGCTPRQVADQLGHRKVSMTTDVYFGRGVMVAAAATILDR